MTASTQSPTAPTDHELVASARGGSATSFELIMRRHNRLLYRTARGIVGDEAQAQDVVQETYLRAFTRLDSFRAEAALGTWLARIAINVALDTVRRDGRHLSLDEHTDASELSTATSSLSPREHTMTSTSSSPLNPLNAGMQEAPEFAAERSQMRGVLQDAINQLPPKYRSVFMLRAVEEMSVEDTAFCLNLSADVVKTRYLRARAMLRDVLGARIEAQSAQVFAFDGAACDGVVSRVMAALRQQGLIR